MKLAHFLRVYNKHLVCKHDCIKFSRRIAWHSFLENNFAEFLDECWLKDIKISWIQWVVGGIWLQQHLLFINCRPQPKKKKKNGHSQKKKKKGRERNTKQN